MMHVMSAPPPAPATSAPASGNASQSAGGDFARMLATHAGQAPTEGGTTSGDVAASRDGEAADVDADDGVPPAAVASGQAVPIAVVAPAAVTADVVLPSEADPPADGESPNAATPTTDAGAPGSADGDAVTTAGVLPTAATEITPAATETTSATAGTSTQASTPASSSQVPPGGPTTAAAATAGVVAAPAVVASDGEAHGGTGPEPSAPAPRPTPGAPNPSGVGPTGPVAGGVPLAAPATGEVAATTAAAATAKVDAPGRGPTVGDRATVPATPAPQGQPDMGAVAPATSDVDGTGPTVNRPTETSRPLPSAVLERVMRAVEALDNAPPPKRVSFEVDGLRLTISLRGDEVSVAVRGGGDQLAPGWQRDLDGALRGRGLGLTDGQGGDSERGGDGRRHHDPRAPHRSSSASPAASRPADPDTSTSLQL